MKAIKIYLILLLLLFNFKYAVSFNPIDENLIYRPEKIADFEIIKDRTGAYNNPGSFYFSFSVQDKKNNNIFYYSKTNFSIFVGDKKIKNFLLQSTFNNYKIYIPRLPYQNKNGEYDLKIKIFSNNEFNLKFCMKKLITYKTPEPEKINLILIIDTSASMYFNDKRNFRQRAIRNIINFTKVNKNIFKIAIIKFSSTAETLCTLTSVHNTSLLNKAISQINANGETNIGDAIDRALKELKKAGPDEKSITILLTDGENTLPYYNNHLKFKKLNSPIYTIGLANNVNNALLNKIAESTGGIYYSIANSFKIQNLYLKIISKEINKKIFFSEDFILKPYQMTNISFYPDTTIEKLNIFSFWENRDISITTIPQQEQHEKNKFANFQFFNLKDLKNTKYLFKITNRSDKINKISFLGFVDSNLNIRSYLSKTYNYLKEPVELSILVFQDDQPITDSKIYAYIYSAKTNHRIRLYDDGMHNDNDKNDGLYKNYFLNKKAGNYKVIFKIRGENLYSEYFFRKEYKNFITANKENKKLKITPSNIQFQKTGFRMNSFQSLKLFSMYTNNISTKIVAIDLSYSNNLINDIPIKIKPDFIILQPYKNKLFNINAHFINNEKNGLYSGNLILIANNDFFSIPLKLDYYKYCLPKNSVLIRR